MVIRNGGANWAVIYVRTSGSESIADFYLGGVTTLTPETSISVVTKGCG